MKKYIILTSVLALSACGGGSGGGGGIATPSSPTTGPVPDVKIQGFSGGTTVNQNNAQLTNMSSYTNSYVTDEATSKQEMIDYVSSKLAAAGFNRDNSSRAGVVRGASRVSMAPRATTDDVQFANADAVLTRMKQIIHDMVLKSGDELTQYVRQYKHYIAEALIIADAAGDLDDPQNATVDELIAAFNTFATTNGITADNLVEKMDEFDQTNFGVSKERMENIRLVDTGQDAYFKFKLDETGKIESVSLWENPIGEYGTAWTDASLNHQVRIILNNSGEAFADYGHGLNPFENLEGIGADGYMNSDAGYLQRTGNGTAFTNTMYRYVFNVGEDDFEESEIISNTPLTLVQAKERLKQYVIERVNKKLHSQPGDDGEYLTHLVNTANTALNTIDDLTTVPEYQTFTQTATMHGVGKDVQLKYSDFGYSKMMRQMGDESEEQYLTYVGGYDTRRMDNNPANNNLTSGTTFTGTAIVTVEDEHEDKNDHDNDYLNTALFKDTAATLEYTTSGGVATHMLTMNNLKATDGASENSDWYKTTVIGTENNPNLTYRFDSTGKTIDEGYQFFKVDGADLKRNEADNVAAPIVATDNSNVAINMLSGTEIDTNHKLHGSARAEYYGEAPTNPTEATSGFYVSEHYHSTDNKIKHELAVYGAFGGQKDQ